MGEYKVQCYIAKENNTVVSFNEHFKSGHKEWSKKTEEVALGEFYNEKIRLVTDDI